MTEQSPAHSMNKTRVEGGHLSEPRLRQYHQRSLPPKERVAVNEHLASCDECYRHYSEMYSIPDASTPIAIDWPSSEAPQHLDFDEDIIPYIEGRLDDVQQEIVESHLALCSQCTSEVQELREFNKCLDTPPDDP